MKNTRDYVEKKENSLREIRRIMEYQTPSPCQIVSHQIAGSDEISEFGARNPDPTDDELSEETGNAL
jgi:hypothetical protein